MAQYANNPSTMGFPKSLKRQFVGPLEKTSIWSSFADAQTYARTDSTAYVGQIITIVDQAQNICDTYKIIDTNGTLQLLLPEDSNLTIADINTLLSIESAGE